MAASSIDHAYEDSQAAHVDAHHTNGTTEQHASYQSSDSHGVTGAPDSFTCNQQFNPANYVDSEWSFSTTTETQAELPEPPRRSTLGERLTVSSNAASLSDSAEHSLTTSSMKESVSDLPSATLGTSRPSLSTIAQLPDSSYISALSGSSQSSQLQIPTLAQLDLPETQSYPLRPRPQNETNIESQQSASENTGSQVSQGTERKRRHSLISTSLSQHHILTTSKRSPQAYQSTVASSHGSNDRPAIHHAKKSRSEKDIENDITWKHALNAESLPSSSTIPPTSIIESILPGDVNLSEQRELSPGYGTQDMNVQISSAPSIHIPSSPEKPLALDLVKSRSATAEPFQASVPVRAVSQGRGLPVRRPWHGRASSSSTSASFQASSLSLAASSLEKAVSQLSPPVDEDKTDAETSEKVSRPSISGLQPTCIAKLPEEDVAIVPATLSPETRRDDDLLAQSVHLRDSPSRLPEAKTTPAAICATPPSTPHSRNRLFVRDGGLYYLATVKIAGTDLIRVDFDDGNFSEVTRTSLQRSAVAAKLLPGDIVVTNTQSKRTKQQRFAFLRHETSAAASNEESIQKDDTIVVRLEKPPQTPNQKGVEEELQSIPASSVALVAGPHVQDKIRAIDIDQVLPLMNSNEILQGRSRTYPGIVTSSLLSGMGLLFTSVDHDIGGSIPQDLANMNGATVIDSFDGIIQSLSSKWTGKGKGKAVNEPANLGDLDSILLISRGHVTTPKYLQALALGVPCISSMWLEDCIRQTEKLCWKPYALGAGCPSRSGSPILGIQANVIARSAFGLKDLLVKQEQLSIFSTNDLVYMYDEDVAGVKRSELASSLFKLLGGKQVTLKPMSKLSNLPSFKPGCLLLIDGPMTNLSKSAAKVVEAHGFQSWQWLKDCIVSGRIVPAN